MQNVIEVAKYEQLKGETLEEARKYGYTDLVFTIHMAEKTPLSSVKEIDYGN